MKYPVGTTLKVVDLLHGADLDVGDIVKVVQHGDGEGFDVNCYGVISPHDGNMWFLWDDEVEPATNYDRIRGLSSPLMLDTLAEIVAKFKDEDDVKKALKEYLETAL